MPGRWPRIVIALLLIVSATEFALRGPVRLLMHGTTWNDFLSPYIQAKAWAHGSDPYSPRSLISFWPADNERPFWVDAEASNGLLEKKRGMPSPYPMPSLVIIAALTPLPWVAALIFWTVLSTVAVLLAALALLSICGCSLADRRSQLFVAVMLALAPLHTGLGNANPVVLAVSLAALSHWAVSTKRETIAGFLLAIAICLKPTVGGGLLIYYVVRRKWRIAGMTCLIAVFISGIGAIRMASAGVHWWASYAENTRKMFATGSVDDFTRSARLRFDMINVQIVLGSFLTSPVLVNTISRLLAVFLFVVWLLRCMRRQSKTGLLEISTVLVLSLVAVYHRFYDAVLLIWPVAWSILLVKKNWVTGLTMVAIAPFFVPGQAMLAELTGSGQISSAVAGSWWWNGVVLPHQAWFLLLLSALLLRFMDGSMPDSEAVSASAVAKQTFSLDA
jgi:hypothetical protein